MWFRFTRFRGRRVKYGNKCATVFLIFDHMNGYKTCVVTGALSDRPAFCVLTYLGILRGSFDCALGQNVGGWKTNFEIVFTARYQAREWRKKWFLTVMSAIFQNCFRFRRNRANGAKPKNSCTHRHIDGAPTHSQLRWYWLHLWEACLLVAMCSIHYVQSTFLKIARAKCMQEGAKIRRRTQSCEDFGTTLTPTLIFSSLKTYFQSSITSPHITMHAFWYWLFCIWSIWELFIEDFPPRAVYVTKTFALRFGRLNTTDWARLRNVREIFFSSFWSRNVFTLCLSSAPSLAARLKHFVKFSSLSFV